MSWSKVTGPATLARTASARRSGARGHDPAAARAASLGPIALVMAALVLAGCGFRPLYGKTGDVATSADLAGIKVAVIADRIGQQMRNDLLDRLNPEGRPKSPHYRLEVKLTESISETAVEQTEIATRANLSINAEFALIFIKDGSLLTEGRTFGTRSYNIRGEEFADLSSKRRAQRSVLEFLSEDIRNRLAVFFKRWREQARSRADS